MDEPTGKTNAQKRRDMQRLLRILTSYLNFLKLYDNDWSCNFTFTFCYAFFTGMAAQPAFPADRPRLRRTQTRAPRPLPPNPPRIYE